MTGLPGEPDAPVRVVAMLGVAQTLAWASSYYLPAMIATPMARDLGVGTSTVFAAFSIALVIAAAIGPFAGRSIDRWGGRPVLATTNVVFACGLVVLGLTDGPTGLFAAWVVMGVAMGSGLYEGAFAALVRLYGQRARGSITGITLVAGFASTVGWPLSAWLEAHVGWRGACLAWAALHLVVGLPLNLLLPKALHPHRSSPDESVAASPPASLGRSTVLLSVVFAITWFISTAMAAHLPRLLIASGTTIAIAVLVGTLVGPAQVAARLFEFAFLQRLHPLLSARVAALMHPAGAALLVCFGSPLVFVFALLHGAGNGILTIAKGTLPLVLFGARGYGRRQGALAVPARFAQALAPWLLGLALDRYGVDALWLTAALGSIAFAALLALPRVIPASRDG